MDAKRLIEKIYAGWLGKLAGIRLGAPVEMWTREQIAEKFGGRHGYLADYPLFAADDDSNGPAFFIRALSDSGQYGELTSADVGRAWLNYAPRGRGMFWWGGYGVSSEHTAYENMRAGIEPPYSGSIAMNGETIAQQIGGQIFIDAWGLVCPGRPEEAARLAAIAARVAHDGEAVYGGQYVAACIAAAFDAGNVREAMERALSLLPDTSVYARCVRDVMRFHDETPGDAWACFDYIKKRYWRDRFGGNCHIIPNAALMTLAMCYGGGDFGDTIELCNQCGFDTDCNVGNVGAIMGVLAGVDGIGEAWLEPINDVFVCSGTVGALNLRTASGFARELARFALRLGALPRDAEVEQWTEDEAFEFSLPGATCGMMIDDGGDIKRGLRWEAGELIVPRGRDGAARACLRTYLTPSDFIDDRYSPSFSPLFYPGQTARLAVRADGLVRAYADVAGLGGARRLYGEAVRADAGAVAEITVPPTADAVILRVGVEADADDARLARVTFAGAPRYCLRAGALREENWSPCHSEISQFSAAEGSWRLENGRVVASSASDALLLTGGMNWTDVDISARVYPRGGAEAGVAFLCGGVIRGYAALMRADGRVRLVRLDDRRRDIAGADMPPAGEDGVVLRVRIKNGSIHVDVDGSPAFTAQNESVRAGCAGLVMTGPGVAAFGGLAVNWHDGE